MSDKKTIAETITFVVSQLKAANVQDGRISCSASYASLDVRRTFHVQGTLNVDFVVTGASAFTPRVSVNFPACNKSVVPAAAFQRLVNELVPLAATLQAQLDEFLIVEA